jgi:hypothetical protein
MPNYKSFDDVLKELDMDEDELKRLVSEGQIRAFRDDDRMKFRSEDVQALMRARTSTGGTHLDLGETQLSGEGLEIIEEETDETLLDLGSLSSDADFEDTGNTSVPTVELSDIGEDKDATLTEELVFDETDELGGLDFGNEDADATQKIEGGLDLTDDDELGLQTEPVDTAGLDELDELDEVGVGQGAAAGGDDDYQYAQAPGGMPGPVQIQEAVRYVEIVPNEGIAWKVLTGITFILVMFLLITPPAIGMVKSHDVLGGFWGSSAYALYLKGPNSSLATSTYEPADKNKPVPEAFSVGNKPTQVVWPGSKIIRDVEGYAPGSGASGGTDQ